ncbi:uncharacterized protein LOC119655884 [Hermetia illucens]|uniref:uncharacterized protein LOC119655884 n=1 Tax=Hermetia illucens TaxID=343691 RepID=UPI0018CC4521|nr:uncharacterized protein LOC119655884 [Hermetia illucens]
MADDLSDIWQPLEYPKRLIPQEWVEQLTPSVLNEYQIYGSKEKAFDTNIEDLEYLNEHPEVRSLIRVLFQEIVRVRPVDIQQFFRDFFNRPMQELEIMVSEHINDIPVTEPRSSSKNRKPSVNKIQQSIANTDMVAVFPLSQIYFPDNLQIPATSLSRSSEILIDSQNLQISSESRK